MHVQWHFPRAVRIGSIVALGVLLIPAAASVSARSHPSAHTKSTAKTRLSATLSEFAVRTNRGSARPGEVTFTVRNTGDKTHELVVLRTNVAQGALPQTARKVKERGAVRVVDEVEDVRPGSKRSLTVRLAPGRYVLICNLAGHYAAGMHAALRVT